MRTDIAFYRHAFLRHAPRRYAVMQPPTADRKYDDYPGELTDAQIAAHLDGQAAYAVPYAENGLAHLLAFDIDAGGRAALHALMREAERRNLFAFGQHDHHRNRGYVWIPFDDLASAERLRLLGDELIAAIMRRQSLLQNGQAHPWHIENRATNEDTRLPFARHRWSGVYGLLYLPGQVQPFHIDADPRGALDDLIAIYRENSTDQLPPPPAPAETRSATSRPAGQGYDIARFNAEHDLIYLLDHHGAKRAGRRLFLCPFHDDQHASLVIWQNHAGVTVCQCKSRHSACPLAERPGCDAFYVHCVGERLTPQQALRRLNGLPDNPEPKPGPQTPPAASRIQVQGKEDYYATTTLRQAGTRQRNTQTPTSTPPSSSCPTPDLPRCHRGRDLTGDLETLRERGHNLSTHDTPEIQTQRASDSSRNQPSDNPRPRAPIQTQVPQEAPAGATSDPSGRNERRPECHAESITPGTTAESGKLRGSSQDGGGADRRGRITLQTPPQTPPAAPQAAPARGGYHETPPPAHSAISSHIVLSTQHQTIAASASRRPTQQARETAIETQRVRQAQLDAFDHEPHGTSGRRRLLRAIQARTGASLWSWASVEQYAADAQLSERATRTGLRWLEARGYLKSHPRIGETTGYRLTAPRGGGQESAPTWNHEIPTLFNLDLASRGGQDAPPPASDQAEPAQAGMDTPASVSPPGGQALVLVEQLVGTQGEAQAGASYEPSAVEMDDRRGDRRREWHATLRPSELYAVLYAERDMYERWQVCQDQAEELVLQEQLESFGLADAGGSAELGDVSSQVEQPPAAARRRVVPTDPAQRAKYYKFLGAAKKAKSEAQARRLRELAAALLVEVDDEDQGDELPAPAVQRTIARTPHAVRPRGCSTSAPPPPPTSCPGPELSPGGWEVTVAGGSWCGVHAAGYRTALYINPEAVRRAIDRREYRS